MSLSDILATWASHRFCQSRDTGVICLKVFGVMMPEVRVGTGRTAEGLGGGGCLSVVHLPHSLPVSSKRTSSPSVISSVPKQVFLLCFSSVASMELVLSVKL